MPRKISNQHSRIKNLIAIGIRDAFEKLKTHLYKIAQKQPLGI